MNEFTPTKRASTTPSMNLTPVSPIATEVSTSFTVVTAWLHSQCIQIFSRTIHHKITPKSTDFLADFKSVDFCVLPSFNVYLVFGSCHFE